MRTIAPVLIALLARGALAGHTRPGYVDGCRSADGRYQVTAESRKDPQGKDGWQFTWKDTKTGETRTGWLVGIPYGLEHFRVAYAHIFVPPGGETFAVWQTANWAPCDRKPPGGGNIAPRAPGDDFKNYIGFRDRLVIYKKTGEVVKRLGIKDILRDNEWIFVNWVQGNLYWLREYPDVMTGGSEPPRCGWRYYRVSPDYSVLEFTVGPNSDAVHKVKDLGPEVEKYARRVRVSLVDGSYLDPDRKLEETAKVPGRPFVGALVKRGEQMVNFVPSLDPVRVEGTIATK